MPKKYIFWFSLLLFLMAGCEQIEDISPSADVSQIEEARFYGDLQATVARVQIPISLLGLVNLAFGWKLGRVGLMLNGVAIGGLVIYTYLTANQTLDDENLILAASVSGGILIGILTFFLYNLMALLIGGAIGTTILGGTWLQVLDQVPPQVLVFVSSFVSALVMFVVFRLFLVAFSAVIGAALLMLAIPFETLWAIPVIVIGILMQTGIAWWIKDDIFENLRGDLWAAIGEGFGEVLGPFSTLRNRQQEKQAPAVYAPPQTPRQQNYQAPPYNPPPQNYQAPPYNPPPQNYQAPPYNPPQQNYQAPPQNYPPPVYQAPTSAAITQPNLKAFKPESWQISLSDGRILPLIGSHITVGRANDNSIIVIDPEVSSHHLIISVQPEGIIVWDNGSTNGTLFNGEYLQGSRRWTSQDILQIGAVTLRLIPSQT